MKLKGAIVLGIIGMVIMTSFAASAGKSNTLTTDKSAYDMGEVVIITFTNNGDEAVVIPDGYIILNEAGKEIYSPNCLMYTPPLAPGESRVYTWNLIRNDGKIAEQGDYTVYTSWDTAEFKIFDTAEKLDNGGKGKAIGVPEPNDLVRAFA
ncbi:MAG: hypothetical protein KAS67_05530 [Thermoplasmata archaeon]|nr:hypothetical protein [Thermoplasmata archaeon]